VAASPAASARQGSSGSRTIAIHRAAFTLVELLLVIGIIGLLTAISVPVVMQSLAKARNAAIKAEIDMLHMAIMNYKAEYGSFPPCFDAAPNQGSPAGQHIKRLFPRSNILAEFTTLQNGGLLQPLTPNNSLTTWLSGYTTDPRRPLTGGPRQPLYDFDKSRVTGGAYHPAGKPESPYVYLNASQYGKTPGYTAYTAELNPLDGNMPFNLDTFQILCAGRDGVYNTDDDLSNFWPGTRKEYEDTVKQ
jgi:prepilin-type N-terminal cleavage/methylation domain-containing protein